MKILKIEKKIIETEIIFGFEEINLLKKCLQYTNHRVKDHKESGINKIICDSERTLLTNWMKNI